MIIVASGDAVLYKTSTLHNFYNAPRRRKIPDGDQLMADNFLPDCHPAVTHGTKNTLRCLIRDTAFHATPEELVRQRVLHWLIHTKGWKKNDLRLEKSYKLVGDPARKRIRADLELLNDGKVVVVVECKRGDVPLGEHVDRQAIEYAIKGRAKWIWTTNGESHRFLQKSGSDWPPVESLEPLGVLSAPPVAELKVPTNANDRRAVERYWKAFGDQQVREDRGSYDCNFVLAVHRVLFDKDMRQKLPYSMAACTSWRIADRIGISSAMPAADTTILDTQTSTRPHRGASKPFPWVSTLPETVGSCGCASASRSRKWPTMPCNST